MFGVVVDERLRELGVTGPVLVKTANRAGGEAQGSTSVLTGMSARWRTLVATVATPSEPAAAVDDGSDEARSAEGSGGGATKASAATPR